MTTKLLRRDAAFNLEELQTLVAELVELYGDAEHHPSTIYLEPKPVFALEEETLTDGSTVLNLRVELRDELDRPCYTPPIEPARAELLDAGGALAECLEFALETHIYEPGEVPPDSGELLALEAWRRVTAPAPIARRDNVEYHQGANARRDGEPESANPFTASSDPDSRHARWALGWQEGAPGAELELTVAPQPVPIGPPAYEEEPEEERTGVYRVRFYKQTTTTDRHSIVVRASSPEAARERVSAWGTGKIELTEAEELTDTLEREEGIDASEYEALADARDPYAVAELEAAELA